jgi:hypothetical protein
MAGAFVSCMKIDGKTERNGYTFGGKCGKIKRKRS